MRTMPKALLLYVSYVGRYCTYLLRLYVLGRYDRWSKITKWYKYILQNTCLRIPMVSNFVLVYDVINFHV